MTDTPDTLPGNESDSTSELFGPEDFAEFIVDSDRNLSTLKVIQEGAISDFDLDQLWFRELAGSSLPDSERDDRHIRLTTYGMDRDPRFNLNPARLEEIGQGLDIHSITSTYTPEDSPGGVTPVPTFAVRFLIKQLLLGNNIEEGGLREPGVVVSWMNAVEPLREDMEARLIQPISDTENFDVFDEFHPLYGMADYNYVIYKEALANLAQEATERTNPLEDFRDVTLTLDDMYQGLQDRERLNEAISSRELAGSHQVEMLASAGLAIRSLCSELATEYIQAADVKYFSDETIRAVLDQEDRDARPTPISNKKFLGHLEDETRHGIIASIIGMAVTEQLNVSQYQGERDEMFEGNRQEGFMDYMHMTFRDDMAELFNGPDLLYHQVAGNTRQFVAAGSPGQEEHERIFNLLDAVGRSIGLREGCEWPDPTNPALQLTLIRHFLGSAPPELPPEGQRLAALIMTRDTLRDISTFVGNLLQVKIGEFAEPVIDPVYDPDRSLYVADITDSGFSVFIGGESVDPDDWHTLMSILGQDWEPGEGV